MSLFHKFAQKEHSLATRIAVTLGVGGFIFLFLLPYVIVTSGPRWDQNLGLPGFAFGIANYHHWWYFDGGGILLRPLVDLYAI